jgi:hypothetical protein
MVCDEEGVEGSTKPLEAINLRSKNGAMGTPCVIVIATVASEAGRCILAVSLQGKLLLMGQKVTLVLPPEAISSTSIVLWRINPNGVASGRPFCCQNTRHLFWPLIASLEDDMHRGEGQSGSFNKPFPCGLILSQ